MKTILGTFINDTEIIKSDHPNSNGDLLYVSNLVSENEQLSYNINRKYLDLYCDLYFQPIVDIESQEVVFFEALLRNKPTRSSMKNISMFLDYLHSHPIIHSAFYEWKIEKTAKLLWENIYPLHDKAISINVRPSNWMGPILVKKFQNILKAYNISPNRLIIEVTEDCNINSYPIFIDSLNRLNDIGFKLAVDDYGAGSATYDIFKIIDFDIMKIDKRFVINIIDCKKSRLILSNIIQLAKSLGMKVVAEGVESTSVLEALENLGVDYIQGYHIERPSMIAHLKHRY